jgi:hypothetical protein
LGVEFNTHMKLIRKYIILGYFRYVDDIQVTFNEEFTNIKEMLSEFKPLSPKRKFTSELEENGKISFLDVTTTNSQNSEEGHPQ